MAAPESARLSVIRSAVADAAERRTLRGIAAEIGMSHPGVLAFLGGSEPRPTTLKKLNAWYTKHAAETGAVDADAVSAALVVLLTGVRKPEREGAHAGTLAALRKAYTAGEAPPPEGLKG